MPLIATATTPHSPLRVGHKRPMSTRNLNLSAHCVGKLLREVACLAAERPHPALPHRRHLERQLKLDQLAMEGAHSTSPRGHTRCHVTYLSKFQLELAKRIALLPQLRQNVRCTPLVIHAVRASQSHQGGAQADVGRKSSLNGPFVRLYHSTRGELRQNWQVAHAGDAAAHLVVVVVVVVVSDYPPTVNYLLPTTVLLLLPTTTTTNTTK